MPLRILLATVALAVSALPAFAAPAPQAGGSDLADELTRSVGLARGQAVLDGGEPPASGLQVVAELRVDDEAEATAAGGLAGELGVWVTRLSPGGAGGRWALTVIATVLEDEPWVHHELLDAAPGLGGEGWAYFTDLEVSLDLQDAVVVVEELDSGRWGAGFLEIVERLPATPAGFVVLGDRRRGPAAAPPTATELPRASGVIQLVAPAERPLTGRTRFRTVISVAGVARTVFYLDDRLAAEDEREPFTAVLDLGAEAVPHRIRVEAFGSSGQKIGEDQVTINAETRPFRVRIGALEATGTDAVRVEAEVSFPPWERLDRVEFYRNEQLAATLYGPPFTAEVAAAAEPVDFVRVVVHLASGDSREDARLFSETISERIEVNLVEVYAVVTDREGDPVRDLERRHFRLRRGRQPIAVERFGLAEEVPLVLGLMIDSSLSMWTQMIETRQAAARFVAETLQTEDRAFVVDFDTRPRVAQALTGDVATLLRSLGALRAGGATAIYDAASFSLDQFEREPGRRALVLLTDGHDQGSSLTAGHCAREARRLGVPLYIIVLSPEVQLPGLYPRNTHRPSSVDFQLQALARETGGRLFFIEHMENLGGAYARINAELRSQYLLAFSSAVPLSRQELDVIRVEVEGRGLRVRTVTLNR